ncbi:MAG: hypothetical protein WEF86_14645 [Gemmatimonadota bacterium]
MRRRDVALRFVQLNLGLFGVGLAIALFIRSQLGLGPWDAFHYGLHLQTGLSVGAASIVTGLVIVFTNLVLGVRPGVGTLLNMVLIGVFMDLLLAVVPDAASLPVAAAYFASAILLFGLASGAYMAAGFGHGPRDGMMMALTLRTRRSVRSIRTMIELSALLLGWLMGGPIGIGTVLVTTTIGHSVHWGLRVFGALPGRSTRGTATRSEATRSWWRLRMRRAA